MRSFLAKRGLGWLVVLASASPATAQNEVEVAPPSAPARDPNDPFVPIDDPMLAPIAPARETLKGWRQALQLIRTRSPSLQTAYAQIEVARGRARMSLAGALPRLTGTAQLSHQLILNQDANATANSFFPATVFTTRADLIVPLLSARNWYDYATARRSIDKMTLDSAEAERRVIAGLAEAVVGVVTAERLAEVTRLNLSYALSTLELNEKRESFGATNSIDVLRAEQEVARSRATIIASDETLRRARESLGQALGYDHAWGVAPNVRLDELKSDAQKTCSPGHGLESRADMRALGAAEKIAERNVTSVDLAFLPTINGLTAVTASTNDFATGSRGPVAWSIGGLLTWPLYEGGFRYGEHRQNAGLLEVSRQQVLDAKRTAQIEVTQAYRGVDVARQNLDVSRSLANIAESASRLTRVKFVNGNGTSFDMVDTQRAARETQIDVTVKEFELVRAEIIAFLALASCDI